MPNSFEELLKGQEYLGTMGDMPGTASQKSMLMIFIADNSGSMYGERMASLNQAFREMVPVLQKIQPPVPKVPSRLGQVMPPSKDSLYSFLPKRAFSSQFSEWKGRLSQRGVDGRFMMATLLWFITAIIEWLGDEGKENFLSIFIFTLIFSPVLC